MFISFPSYWVHYRIFPRIYFERMFRMTTTEIYIWLSSQFSVQVVLWPFVHCFLVRARAERIKSYESVIAHYFLQTRIVTSLYLSVFISRNNPLTANNMFPGTQRFHEFFSELYLILYNLIQFHGSDSRL